MISTQQVIWVLAVTKNDREVALKNTFALLNELAHRGRLQSEAAVDVTALLVAVPPFFQLDNFRRRGCVRGGSEEN
jgi:hypothetical protein